MTRPRRIPMNTYQIARKLGLSRRRVLTLFAEGRIANGLRIGKSWFAYPPISVSDKLRGPAGAWHKPESDS